MNNYYTTAFNEMQLALQEQKVIECMMLFRKGISPSWEDPRNEKGGSLVVELKPESPEQIDGFWQELVFSMLGNSFRNN